VEYAYLYASATGRGTSVERAQESLRRF
jgi:hypothetical protein